MKVVFYLDNLKGGGVQRRTMRLLKGIVEQSEGRFIDLNLVINQGAGENINMVPAEVKLHVLGGKAGRQLNDSLESALISLTPDIVVCCMGQQFIQAIKHKGKLLGSCRWYIIQAVPVNLIANSWYSNLIRKLAIRYFYPKADKVLCVSKDVQSTVDRLGLQRKTLTIYNPVVSENLLDLSNEPAEHEFFSKEHTVLVAAGRLNVQKDYFTLIKAFYLLKKMNANNISYKLLILGGGELLEKINSLVCDLGLQDDVDLVGFVDNPYKKIKKSDLFVMSSLWEGLPNAMIEALAIGKKVVSTDCIAGPREILDNGKYGTLVPMQDPEALANGIIYELEQNRDTEVLVRRGWMFSVKNSAENYIKLFENGKL